MNEEELSLKVQKNWIRIKHETQNIREKLMDKLLEDGAVTVDEMRDIKSRIKEDQFDFLLYRVIESRKCKLLLRVLETYGRRPLCVAIRKTELTTEDFNTTTQTKLKEVKQKSADCHLHSLSKELKDFHVEMGETVTSLNQHIDEMGQRMEVMDTKMDSIVVKKKEVKKEVKKKGRVANAKGSMTGDLHKFKEDSERLRKLVCVKGDEVFKLRAQLQAKSEQIKWLRKQLDDKDSSGKSLTASLKQSKDEQLKCQRRLYDSKREQLELSNQLLANEEITKELKEKISAIEDETKKMQNEKHASFNKESVNDEEDKRGNVSDETLSGTKKKRVTFKTESDGDQKYAESLIHELARALETVLEEREYVNKLIRVKNSETLKLTVHLRAKTEENDRLQRQVHEGRSLSYETRDLVKSNDLEIVQTKEQLSIYMQEIEELSEKLKPITRTEKEITEKLKKLEQ